ncbi:MAG: hypothetical protein KC493_01050 [Bacteriovoracaceae bacterium]|nr:hypothetical protein [Bacteriovoracaceae bacterium]
MTKKKYKSIYDSISGDLEELLVDLGLELSDEGEQDDVLVIGPSDSESHLTLDQPPSITEFFQKKGEAVVCPHALKDPLFSQMVRNVLKEGGFINVEGMSGGQILDSENVKMVDHMSVGYYSDIISTDAFELGFNFVRVRNYLSNALTYFSYLNKGDIAFIPVDIEYGTNDTHMMVQVHANVQNFVKDYLWESLGDEEAKSPFSALLKNALSQTDFLSVTYLKSAGKVIFTSAWSKKIPIEGWFTSLAIKDIQSFEERKEELLTRPRVKVVKTTVKMESDDLPGKSTGLMGGTEDNKKNLVKIKRVVEVIQKVKKSEGVEVEEVTQEDIEAMINNMDPEKLGDISDDEKEYILGAVKDPKELNKIDAGIDRVLDNFEGEKYVDLFSESIEDLSAEEVNTYLKKGEGEDEGVSEEIWEVKKGKIVEDLKSNSEEIRKSGGGRTELNAEVLKLVTRELEAIEDDCAPMVNELSDKVTEQMISEKIESSGGNVETMALEHSREVQTLQNQVSSANERATRMKKLIDIMKGQIASMAAKEKNLNGAEGTSDNSNSDHEVTDLKKQLNNALAEIKNRDSTIDKIRKSNEMESGSNDETTSAAVEEKMQEVDSSLENISSDSDNIEEQLNKKVLFLKNALEQQTRETKQRDSTIQKIRQSNEKIIETKDKEIEKLKNKPVFGGPAAQGSNAGGEASEGESLNAIELDEENKNLKTQLEMMTNRLSQLNENMEAKTKAATQKAEADMLKLRQDNQKATSTINKLKEEKERVNRLLKKSQQSSSMLEEDVRLLKIEASHRESEQKEAKAAGGASSGDAAKVKELQNREVQFTEKLKAASLKIKSYEQKIKFMQAQVNATQGGGQGKKKKGPGRAEAAGGNDQKFQLKIKQLETLKGKAEEATKKAQADLNNAKKSNVQLKSELNATKLKLDEAERKIGKKAS